MVLVRLAYVADLPAPAELVMVLAEGGGSAGTAAVPAASRRDAGAPVAGAAPPIQSAGPSARRIESAVAAGSAAVAAPRPAPELTPPPSASLDPMPQSFAEVVALFDQRREAIIAAHLKAHVHLVAFEPGRIEIRPTEAAPSNLINQLSQRLMEWTGERWLIARSEAAGAPTVAETEARRETELRSAVATHPLVRAVLDIFPGATIAAVRDRVQGGEAGAEEDILDDAGGDATDDEDGTSAEEGER